MKSKAPLCLLLSGALSTLLLIPAGGAAAKGRKPLTVGNTARTTSPSTRRERWP
jgi:hypothetical protein